MQPRSLNIAVLCDGGGLARDGLKKAGHKCTGIEIDPIKHYLSSFVGDGNCLLGDMRDFDLSSYDAVWSSPPCQKRSRMNGTPSTASIESYKGYDDLLAWSLALQNEIVWVENVFTKAPGQDDWGEYWNAAQFLAVPIQNRNRIIGGGIHKTQCMACLQMVISKRRLEYLSGNNGIRL